ncbi:MAG: LSU rRNA pseudouridine(2605) synthase [Pseudolabrys sp.]|jgi:23S rRNA pseudouridine2605 synthase|nr:LSU rRNA pseudouridine(2605) synthase [Pseudolabrys sp.]
MTNPHQGERIAKVMARAGLASRREAEAWIAAGRVSVNGQPISSPALNVTPADKITIDGAPLRQRERARLFLYHKPRGLVTTHSDPQGRPTIFAALPKNLPRLISVGRLDLNTEGLILLTNDGGLARTLELPQTAWLRRYRVRALGRVTQDALDRLRNGVTVKGVRYGPVEATFDREQGANVWLTIGIREGKNREVRNVLEHLGLKVNRLIRIAFGPFELGALERGDVQELTTDVIRTALGDLAAGVDLEGLVLEHDDTLTLCAAGRRSSLSRKAGEGGERPTLSRKTPPDFHREPGEGQFAKTRSKKPRRDRSGGPRPSRPKPSSKPAPRGER